MSTPGQERMRTGDNVCARATTGAAWEGCFFTNTPNFSARATTSASVRRWVLRGMGVFSQTPQISTLGRRRLRLDNNACVRATTSALARRHLEPVFLMLAFFCALAIQTKLFHYLFLKITQIVLKMVIQSYFY